MSGLRRREKMEIKVYGMRTLLSFCLIICIRQTSYSQACECPEDLPYKTFLYDYNSAKRSTHFFVCFKDEVSFKKNGTNLSTQNGCTLITCNNYKAYKIDSSFYQIELHYVNGSVVVRKIAQLPHLYINNDNGWMFQSRIIEQLEFTEGGIIKEVEDILDIQNNLDEVKIKRIKKNFYEELEKANNEPEYKIQYWKHAINLAVCALNGDSEARICLLNYPGEFNRVKGRVIYVLGEYKEVFDGKMLNNLNSFIDWYLVNN